MATKTKAKPKTKYGKQELEYLWLEAGGPEAEAKTAAAIALAESGGNPDAVNPEGPEHAEGLWQIKGQIVKGNPLNPQVSAKNAVAKYNAAKGFSPWVTYTSGAYKSFLGKKEGEGGGGGGNSYEEGWEKSANETVDAAEESGKVLAIIGEWLGDPTRLGKLVAGGALLYMGLHSLTSGTAAEGAVEAPAKLAKKLGGAAVGAATDGGSTAAKKAMKLKKKTTKSPAKKATKATAKGSRMKPMKKKPMSATAKKAAEIGLEG